MTASRKGFLIGKVADRTGITVSAIRHYEMEGLVQSTRDAGGRRVFEPADIRRISFVIITQKLGFSLSQIREELALLPQGRTPTKKDWQRISRSFGRKIDERIESLTLLREKLTGCIGCGCLSLKKCALYNAQDVAQKWGAGPRYLMGNTPKN